VYDSVSFIWEEYKFENEYYAAIVEKRY